MGTQWVLQTNGNPLATVRKFLGEVWLRDNLEGMLIPAYDHNLLCTQPLLLEVPSQLENADPFLPLTLVEIAGYAVQLAKQRPDAHLGIILRSCENRTLEYFLQSPLIARRAGVPLSNWLIISVDCLSSYPVEDYTWRFNKSGSTEPMTHESLNFARRGGIAPYRYRPACQMCTLPAAQEADLVIGLLGLPVFEEILIITKDQATADRLDLSRITNNPASPALITRRSQMIETLNERRSNFWKRAVSELSNDMPGGSRTGSLGYKPQVAEFIEMLRNCAPCQACLEACPIYDSELLFRKGLYFNPEMSCDEGSDQITIICHWLAACISCGMCEDVCPKHKPLTAVIGRIRDKF